MSDWGAVQNKSVRVRLDAAPRPLVSPLALTLIEGEPLELSCLSLGGGPLGFRWLRNGQLLPPKGPEHTEDLYPAGSRLVLSAARASATYTCVATGPLGADRADALVTVLSPHGEHGRDILSVGKHLATRLQYAVLLVGSRICVETGCKLMNALYFSVNNAGNK